MKWLGCKVDEEYIQSDRLPIYYEYTERLIADGNAYVCECPPEEFHNITLTKQACPCRNLPASEHLERWKRMLNGGYTEGQAVVRVKTDLEHPNPAVRDWPALRIIDTKKYPHPTSWKQIRCLATLQFSSGVRRPFDGHDPHHPRQRTLTLTWFAKNTCTSILGWTYPEAIHYGRLKITGAFLSKSKIVQGIKEGIYTGFDDPRLGTFAALRKRGITPEAIKKMIIDVGIKPNDVTLSWENLYAYNRKILDATSNRYFFVPDPVELKVLEVPKTFHAKLPLHPDKPERGFREYTVLQKAERRRRVFGFQGKTQKLWKVAKSLGLWSSSTSKSKAKQTGVGGDVCKRIL